VTGPDPTVLRCAECGERIALRRGAYIHVGRVVAGCDLDADHAPVPERPPPDEAPPERD
jgi:hypothetical protein